MHRIDLAVIASTCQEFTGCAHVQEIAVDTCFATLFSAVLVAVHGCAGACGSFQCSYGCGGCAVTGATVSMQILLQLIVVVVLLVAVATCCYHYDDYYCTTTTTTTTTTTLRST